MDASRLPTVSVVVPTKNRPYECGHMLESLRAQPTRPLEVIVIDQSDERYRLEPFPQLLHVHDPEVAGAAAARNRGADMARGDIVLFVDDDVEFVTDCVAEVALGFAEHPALVGAQCSIHNPEDDQPLSLYAVSTWIFEHGFFNQRPMRKRGALVPRLIDGLASAYRRDLFALERFDDALPGYSLAEDWDLTKRAARHGDLIVLPGALVRHLHSPTNRHGARAYMQLRRKNILYLYDKLEAGRDPRNRLCRSWWILGENLRGLKYGLRERPRHSP